MQEVLKFCCIVPPELQIPASKALNARGGGVAKLAHNSGRQTLEAFRLKGWRTCPLVAGVVYEDKVHAVLVQVVEPHLLLPTLPQVQGGARLQQLCRVVQGVALCHPVLIPAALN